MKFTPAELHLLQNRLNGAVAGLERELNYRRHPLLDSTLRDQRFSDSELVRLYLSYQQLAVWARQLTRPASPLSVDPPDDLRLNGEMQAFLADELALSYAAAAYINHTPFSRRLRHKLLRAVAVEIKFFKFLLDEAARNPTPLH
ncbi:MAG: hypothetical protein Kow0031_10850 [Anaerolineae bacterium]